MTIKEFADRIGRIADKTKETRTPRPGEGKPFKQAVQVGKMIDYLVDGEYHEAGR